MKWRSVSTAEIAKHGGRLDAEHYLPTQYEVIVGNVGTVYSGTDRKVAGQKFRLYVGISREGYGRAGNESVTFMADGEIVQEHQGRQEADHG